MEGEGRLGTERNSKVSCLGCAVVGTVAAAVSSIEDLLSIIRMGWWRVSSGGGAPWVEVEIVWGQRCGSRKLRSLVRRVRGGRERESGSLWRRAERDRRVRGRWQQ